MKNCREFPKKKKKTRRNSFISHVITLFHWLRKSKSDWIISLRFGVIIFASFLFRASEHSSRFVQNNECFCFEQRSSGRLFHQWTNNRTRDWMENFSSSFVVLVVGSVDTFLVWRVSPQNEFETYFVLYLSFFGQFPSSLISSFYFTHEKKSSIYTACFSVCKCEPVINQHKHYSLGEIRNNFESKETRQNNFKFNYT